MSGVLRLVMYDKAWCAMVAPTMINHISSACALIQKNTLLHVRVRAERCASLLFGHVDPATNTLIRGVLAPSLPDQSESRAFNERVPASSAICAPCGNCGKRGVWAAAPQGPPKR